MTRSMQEMVQEFHIKMNLPNPPGPYEQPVDVALLRLRLINEEWGEVSSALADHDIINLADGLADLLYVIYGTAVSYGVVANQPSYALRKTDNARRPDLQHQLEAVISVNQALGNLAESLHTMQADPKRLEMLGRDITWLAAMVLNLANFFNLPIELIFEEVHRSNMTKAPLDEHRKGGKGPGFTPPNIKDILMRFGWHELAK